MTTKYVYHEPSGYSQELDASSMDEACERADVLCREGDWGDDGDAKSIDVYVTEQDEDGEETDRRYLTVEIEADRAVLIRRATGGAGCGDDHDAHDWTREGGCDENPGVWAIGGTSLAFASHCRTCGLRCHETSVGSQRDPGETDTVAYEMP